MNIEMHILLAFSGGVCLGLNRVFLGRMGSSGGAAYASFINHFGGAIFVFLLAIATGQFLGWQPLWEVPIHLHLGGIIGALFVAISSWILPRLGIMKTTVLLIAGQMLMSTVLDFHLDKMKSLPQAILGITLIIAGTLVGSKKKLQ